MIFLCEICERESDWVCFGMNVAALYFCLPHAKEHMETCPDVKLGIAKVMEIGEVPDVAK